MTVTWDGPLKKYRSPEYNYDFNTLDGYFKRWGKTEDDDPKTGPIELMDLEIDERCEGIPSPGKDVATPCTFCYKSNTQVGRYMTFETFKGIFDKLPQSLMQIAFGIGNIGDNGHPDLFKFFDYCINNEHNPGVIPNITTNGYGLTPEIADKIKFYGGGVAVSRYENKDVCYNAVKTLTDAGILQVNIHQVISVESLQSCYDLIDEAATDPRLEKMRYILFLTLKPKGKRNKWHVLKDVNEYRKLIEYAWSKDIAIGFDSCSAPTFLASIKDHPNFAEMNEMTEACESDRFSGYANVEGIWSHCSFTEGLENWGTVDLKVIEDFDRDLWNAPVVKKFRECLTCQNNDHIGKDVFLCPVYKLYDDQIGNSPTAIDGDIPNTFKGIKIGVKHG